MVQKYKMREIGIVAVPVFLSFFILCIAGALDVAAASTIVVNGTCIEGNIYCDTIQEAVDMAEEGDTIIVCPGTYIENIEVNKSLTIHSENGSDSTIVRAKNPDKDVFKVTADYVKIRGFTTEGAVGWINAGIYLYADYCDISDNNCSNNDKGIYLSFSNNNSISNNYCPSNRDTGICLGFSNNNRISNNNCSNTEEGINLLKSNNNSILNNNCSNNDAGIFLLYSNNNRISNNNCSSNKDSGIFLCSSNNTRLTGNILVENGIVIRAYIRYSLSDYMHEIDDSNTVNGKPVYYWKNAKGGKVPDGAGQVILVNCSNITIENQDLKKASIGIQIVFSSHVTMINNNCSNNDAGIHLDLYSNNNIISNNNCSNNERGIRLVYSNNNKLTGNTMNKNWCGIELIRSNNNTIGNNTACENGVGGIHLEDSSENVVSNNVVNKNLVGIALFESNNNEIKNNTACENGIGIPLEDSSENEVSNNTVNINNFNGIVLISSNNNTIGNNTACENGDKGILLQESSRNEVNNNIVNKDLNGILLISSNNNTIGNNTVCENKVEGIHLINSSGNKEVNNIVNKNLNGIVLIGSYSNEIKNNAVCENGVSGIHLEDSSRNEVNNNIANKNFDGIALQRSNNNTIGNNTACENGVSGIHLEDSSENEVRNNIVKNNLIGIVLTRSNNNKITKNDIVNNKRQAGIDNYLYFNKFIYNYWSDYKGMDVNGDGIGDIPYVIDLPNFDEYPYMNYSGWLNVVIKPEYWYFFVKKGEVINKTFSIENRLNNTTDVEVLLDENLWFEANLDGDGTSKKTVSIEPKSTKTITLQLNTTNLEGYILRKIVFRTEEYTKTTLVNGFVRSKIHDVEIEGVDFHRNVVQGQINPFKILLRNYGDKDEFDVKFRMGYIFSVRDGELEKDLNKGVIPERLKSMLKDNGIPLSENATVTKSNNDEWTIIDEGNKKTYIVRKKDRMLNIYRMGVSRTVCLNENEARTILFKIDTSNLPLGINKGEVVVLKDEMKKHLNLTMFIASKREASTLIVTNLNRMAEKWRNDTISGLEEKLIELSFHPSVNGIIVRVENETNCSELYKKWDEDKKSEKANEIAKTIKGLIDSKFKEYPNMEYLVIVGDDRIIPFYRIHDNTDKLPGLESWWTEDDYKDNKGNFKLNKDSTVGSALHNNMFLTDNFYAAEPIEWKTAEVNIKELFIPNIPVSRLVETPEQISAVIEAFCGKEYVRPEKIFVTAYDFMWDTALHCNSTLKEKMNTTPETLISRNNVVTFDFFQKVKEGLLNTSNNILLIFLHADHDFFSVKCQKEHLCITSQDIIHNSTANLNGSVVYTMSCHAGLNVPPNSSINDFDLVEAYAQKGVVAYTAPTGFGIGSFRIRAAHELLLSYFTNYLCEGIDVGTALTLAKQEYWATNYDFNYIDEQVLETTTLYGLPMAKITIPHNITSHNVSMMTIRSTLEEEPDTLIIHPTHVLNITRDGDYYITPSEELLSCLNKPILPKEIRVFHPTRKRVLRGAVMTRAEYHIDEPFKPLMEEYKKSNSSQESPSGEIGKWFPAKIFKLNSIRYPGPHAESRQYLIIITGQYKGDIPKKLPSKFNVTDSELERDLKSLDLCTPVSLANLPERLKKRLTNMFDNASIPLSENSTLIKRSDDEWTIADKDTKKIYVIEKCVGKLWFSEEKNGAERVYDEISFDLYYASPKEEKKPPSINNVSPPARINHNITITVNASDESGIQRVLVTYTDINGEWGEWKSEDCRHKEGDLWSCSIHAEEEIVFFVQAVDIYGNVAIDDNRGQYYYKKEGGPESS